jgi:glycosyltransferase involved in cell wall biosynthesis
MSEFGGGADVAVLHLNPDSWTLLTEAQAAMAARARALVGLWVWEMGRLPDSWRQNFHKVDAIWTPSRYCAAVFEAEAKVPVAVIPHVVPVPPSPDPARRAAVLAALGLAPDARIVLYAFDGSSYLERKNPQALVRAFGASGLAAERWRLVLKTKRLMERPEEGAALMALAEATPGTVVVDRGLSRDDMAALFAAADVYASPHRSEGFGLTLAEAMALGKPVVATDYGGSRDFLDETCGYPVPAREVRAARDFGHYARGGTWAEVDEAAFAEALRRAAASDAGLGERARARVAERLSAEAVGRTMAAALDAVVGARAGRAA